MTEWKCTLPGVVTTVGLVREGQLIGCVCGLQASPQHLQSCVLGCFDANRVREQHRRLKMMTMASVFLVNGLEDLFQPESFKAPEPLSAAFLGAIKGELKWPGIKGGAKVKARAKADRWLKSEERRQLEGRNTHWGYFQLRGYAQPMRGPDLRFHVSDAVIPVLPWQTADQALKQARAERDGDAHRDDDSPETTAVIIERLAKDCQTAEELIKEGEELVALNQKDSERKARRDSKAGRDDEDEDDDEEESSSEDDQDDDGGTNGGRSPPVARRRSSGTPSSAEGITLTRGQSGGSEASGDDVNTPPPSFNEQARAQSKDKKRAARQKKEDEAKAHREAIEKKAAAAAALETAKLQKKASLLLKQKEAQERQETAKQEAQKAQEAEIELTRELAELDSAGQGGTAATNGGGTDPAASDETHHATDSDAETNLAETTPTAGAAAAAAKTYDKTDSDTDAETQDTTAAPNANGTPASRPRWAEEDRSVDESIDPKNDSFCNMPERLLNLKKPPSTTGGAGGATDTSPGLHQPQSGKRSKQNKRRRSGQKNKSKKKKRSEKQPTPAGPGYH